jgi:LysR family glycine cleavage system transcriptional activator
VRRLTPPLEGLEAFLLAAQSESFRVAAGALALSPSAFTRRIQTLEAFLGTSLFDRSAAAPMLTEAGRAYLREIEPALEAIRAATARLNKPAVTVRVKASQSFAISWLMPRSSDFELQTKRSIELVLSRDLGLLRLGRAEVAIAPGPSDFGGLPWERLIELDAAVVAAPRLADGRAPPRCVEDLSDHTLLQVQSPGDLWGRWLAGAGAVPFRPNSSMVFENLALMYEAAANGLGVALAIPTVAEAYLESGRLRPCLRQRAAMGADYNLVFASDAVRRRSEVQAFTQWMRKQAERSRVRFAELLGGHATPVGVLTQAA